MEHLLYEIITIYYIISETEREDPGIQGEKEGEGEGDTE
jgi:hypothetical protein